MVKAIIIHRTKDAVPAAEVYVIAYHALSQSWRIVEYLHGSQEWYDGDHVVASGRAGMSHWFEQPAPE
jgi:hypothetical protein